MTNNTKITTVLAAVVLAVCAVMFLANGDASAWQADQPDSRVGPAASGTPSFTPTRTRTATTVTTATTSISTRTSTRTTTPSPSPTTCMPGWTIVNSPSPGSSYNDLRDVVIITANDAWAVGITNDTGSSRSLIEHWDGSSWSVVPHPDLGTVQLLFGVTASGPNDVWAVGEYAGGGQTFSTYILHWNGSAWAVSSSPNQGTGWNLLFDVEAVSANNVWAVGYYVYGSPPTNQTGTLVLHWNGSAWSIISSPNLGTHSELTAISAISANDIWAVGNYRGENIPISTITEHWDGSTWSIVSSPPPVGGGIDLLYGVVAIAANDVWAVGGHSEPAPALVRPLLLHWNGTAWSSIPGPSFSGNAYANNVSANGSGDVWVAGSQYTGSTETTLVMHWDGVSWQVSPSANVSNSSNRLYSVAVAGNEGWVVGYYIGPQQMTLAERYQSCAQPTPTGTPSPTPAPGVYCVSLAGGLTGAPCTNQTAFTSIQAGIDAATNGSELRIANGAFYATSGNTSAVGIVSRPLTITGGYTGGTNGWTTPGSYTGTSVQGENVRSAFEVQGNTTVSINNLSLAGGGIQANIGTVRIDSSTVRINGRGSIQGHITVASGALLDFNCICTLANGTYITGSGFTKSAFGTNIITVAGSTSVQNLNLAGGEITGAGTLTATGVLSWTGGSMTGTGVTYIAPSAQANIASSTAYVQIDGRTVNNAGTATWFNNGTFYIYTGGAFNNNGIFEVRNTLSFGGTGTFNNTATLRKASDVNNVDINTGIAFNNTGTIQVPNNTLTLSTNNNRAFTFLVGSQITGAGYLRMVSGFAQVNIDGPTTAQNLNLAGGTLGGTSTLTVTGVLSWTGGNMVGAGVTYIPPSAFLNMASSTAYIVLDQRTLNNAGTATWSNAGPFYVRNAGVVNNTGLFDVQNTLYVADTGGTFNNRGIFRKQAGFNFTGSNVLAFNNVGTGVIEVNSGTMYLYQLSNAGGRVLLNGGTFTGTPLNLQGGILTGVGTVSSQIINAGNVSPGLSPGVITNTTSYSQNLTGTLNIELGGLTPGLQYDQLKVTGAATLNGTLNIATTNGYTPNVGDVFTIMTYGSRTGTFATVNSGCTGRTFNVTYNATNVVITVTGTGSPACTPTPTATSTATPTQTALPPTATPTPCTSFSDVPVGSTFYPYITCLVNLGIINGYPDCTFRPGNNVTRGQLSKIVSEAAGFTEIHTTQTFADVPVGSTFYQFIERMATRSMIGGYPCGGAGEPCDGQNRPYFRPNANATRGQISKIDVLAAVQASGWTLLNPSISTFQDVPVGSTFFQHIETAYSHGVVGGYSCGTPPAGACVPPANKPYFVPNNNATRGQTSKIVANTFFPGCQALKDPH